MSKKKCQIIFREVETSEVPKVLEEFLNLGYDLVSHQVSPAGVHLLYFKIVEEIDTSLRG